MGVLDYELKPNRSETETRAERIARFREYLAEAQAKRNKQSVHWYRWHLTREALCLRVEAGDALANRRIEWMRIADEVRNRARQAVQTLERHAKSAEDLRARLATGCYSSRLDTKGKPYAASTLANFRRSLASDERVLTEGPEELRQYLLTSAPPPYHAWRRQRPEQVIIPVGGGAGVVVLTRTSPEHRKHVSGKVISLEGRTPRKRRKAEITIGDGGET